MYSTRILGGYYTTTRSAARTDSPNMRGTTRRVPPLPHRGTKEDGISGGGDSSSREQYVR
jgi:hypothetical protein